MTGVWRAWWITVLVVLLAGCGAAAPATTPGPTDTPIPTSPLVVGAITYPAQIALGDRFRLQIPIRNGGQPTAFRVSLQSFDKADLVGCVPKCTVTTFLGTSAEFPSLARGAHATYQVEYVATKLGVMDVSVCITVEGSDPDCSSGTIVIGN